MAGNAALRVYNFLNTRRTRRLNDLGLATGLAPVYPKESAILITLQPGAYTAIVTGANGGTGVGIVEVFAQ